MKYLGTKDLVSGMCVSADPVGSSLAKVARRHSERALTFDNVLKYLGTKDLVSGLCASTEPVGSSLAK